MIEDTVIFDDNERCDYICYSIQIFIICVLIFVIVYFYIFLCKMIESMSFEI